MSSITHLLIILLCSLVFYMSILTYLEWNNKNNTFDQKCNGTQQILLLSSLTESQLNKSIVIATNNGYIKIGEDLIIKKATPEGMRYSTILYKCLNYWE